MRKSVENPVKPPIREPQNPIFETISVDDLIADPANPRTHPESNRKAVLGSVKRFKPWRSIAIDQGNVVYAGNETANACKVAGFTEVLVVTPQPGQLVAVRRSDMTETEKTGYSIADNATALSSEWAPELPDALKSLDLDGFDLTSLGFTDQQLKFYLGRAEPENVQAGQLDETVMCECPKCGHKWSK